ncbi:hypothetical protein A7K91_04435 [Paenibacillus oryzae]|uniref:Uncharacterized protein n=1 Tax=Paenibacillus oryzae TaxID=1844972 RepID=A0A1A5YGQ9_9BACL|nr:hypothetical protein A7K91_04435 [Paenibacillus oryzae]
MKLPFCCITIGLFGRKGIYFKFSVNKRDKITNSKPMLTKPSLLRKLKADAYEAKFAWQTFKEVRK